MHQVLKTNIGKKVIKNCSIRLNVMHNKQFYCKKNYCVQFHQFLICMFVSFHSQYWWDHLWIWRDERCKCLWARTNLKTIFLFLCPSSPLRACNTICIHWILRSEGRSTYEHINQKRAWNDLMCSSWRNFNIKM